MWDVKTACEKVLQHFIDERNKAPKCVVCDAVLYHYGSEIYNYIYLLEVKHKKIHRDMYGVIMKYVYEHYPCVNDKGLHRHHVNYGKNIQVPTCQHCHGKIHSRKYPELEKWYPVDKKPKNQGNFDTNMYKPLS